MTISVLLRLVPAALASRRLAGEVELVATGERHIVHDVEGLLAVVFGDPQGVLPEPTPAEPGAPTRDHHGA